MTEHIFIYDAEIKNGVATEDNPRQPGFQYAHSWSDFAGMGIACICGYDVTEARYRVIMDDNLSELDAIIASGRTLLGFNNWRFDDRLSRANALTIPDGQTKDLAAAIWRAAGIPNGEHPKGLGLDAICRANHLPGKTGNGADAPQDFQRGRIGRVIDYCLGDVRCTLHLYRYILQHGGITDPRNREWLVVRL